MNTVNMNRRQASKEETKRLILNSARNLFVQKGMEETTFRDIAAKAGVSPASIVVHFKSKTALLEAALGGDIEKYRAAIVASLPEDCSLLECFLHMSKEMLTYYDSNRPLYRELLCRTMFEPSGETPSMTRRYEEYIRFLKKTIEAQKSRGAVSADADSGVLANSLFSMYLGALIYFFRMPEMTVEGVADILESMARQHLEGL